MKKRMKIIGIILGAIIVCIGLLFGGFSYYIGLQVVEGILYQNRTLDTKQNSILHLEKWGYDMEAFKDAYSQSSLTLQAEDQVEISAMLISSDDNMDKDMAIIIHGQGGDHVSTYPVAEVYLKNNWNVLVYDQRASGESKEEIITFGYKEQMDILAVVDYAKELSSGKIVVHGISMGAATAGLYAGTEHSNENVDYIILDSSYDSMENVVLRVFSNMDTGGLPVDYMIWCGDMLLKFQRGFTISDVDIVKAQEMNYNKTLVIQGLRDELCTPEMGEAIYGSIASSQKEIWVVDSAHIDAVIDYPDQYEATIMAFIE